MKGKKYKDTEIGRIPKEWKLVRLKEISSCQNGIWGNDPVPNEKSYPVIRSTEITHSGKINLSTVAFRKIPEKEVSKYSLQSGDILLVASSGSSRLIGRAALFEQPRDNETYLFSNFMSRIRPKNINSKFLYYFSCSSRYRSFLKGLQQTSTGLRNLAKNRLLLLPIPHPSLSEQRKIASILSTVDEAIQKVDEIIAKTEHLKKGLMQELLTKGIGHRNFKLSEELAHEIPEDWEIVRLGSNIIEINRESRDPSKEAPDRIFLYIDINSIEGGIGRIKNPKRILGKEAPSRARRVIYENDVIMSTVRPYLKAFAIVPKEYDNQICSTGYAVLSCRENILPYFLLNVLFSNQVITQCNKMMMGGQYPALNQSQVSQILIPLPPLPEQQKIAEILSTVDKKLEFERQRKEKLRKIKKGLMHELLTGRKRVKINEGGMIERAETG